MNTGEFPKKMIISQLVDQDTYKGLVQTKVPLRSINVTGMFEGITEKGEVRFSEFKDLADFLEPGVKKHIEIVSI